MSYHYIESVLLVPKDKRSWFSEGEKFAVQLPLIVHLPSKSRMETIEIVHFVTA